MQDKSPSIVPHQLHGEKLTAIVVRDDALGCPPSGGIVVGSWLREWCIHDSSPHLVQNRLSFIYPSTNPSIIHPPLLPPVKHAWHPSIHICVHTCIHSPTHSSSIHDFMHVCAFISFSVHHPCMHLLTQSPIYPFLYPCTRPSMHKSIHHVCIYSSVSSSINPCMHTFTYHFPHASIHAYIHPPTHTSKTIVTLAQLQRGY